MNIEKRKEIERKRRMKQVNREKNKNIAKEMKRERQESGGTGGMNRKQKK